MLSTKPSAERFGHTPTTEIKSKSVPKYVKLSLRWSSRDRKAHRLFQHNILTPTPIPYFEAPERVYHWNFNLLLFPAPNLFKEQFAKYLIKFTYLPSATDYRVDNLGGGLVFFWELFEEGFLAWRVRIPEWLLTPCCIHSTRKRCVWLLLGFFPWLPIKNSGNITGKSGHKRFSLVGFQAPRTTNLSGAPGQHWPWDAAFLGSRSETRKVRKAVRGGCKMSVGSLSRCPLRVLCTGAKRNCLHGPQTHFAPSPDHFSGFPCFWRVSHESSIPTSARKLSLHLVGRDHDLLEFFWFMLSNRHLSQSSPTRLQCDNQSWASQHCCGPRGCSLRCQEPHRCWQQRDPAVLSASNFVRTTVMIVAGDSHTNVSQIRPIRFARVDSQRNTYFCSTWPDSSESRLLSDSHWNSRDSRPILAAILFRLIRSENWFARIGPLRQWYLFHKWSVNWELLHVVVSTWLFAFLLFCTPLCPFMFFFTYLRWHTFEQTTTTVGKFRCKRVSHFGKNSWFANACQLRKIESVAVSFTNNQIIKWQDLAFQRNSKLWECLTWGGFLDLLGLTIEQYTPMRTIMNLIPEKYQGDLNPVS